MESTQEQPVSEAGPAQPVAPRRRLEPVAVLLAAAALAFLLPFGTVSCDDETVHFTGVELALHDVDPSPGFAVGPDKGLAGEVEGEIGFTTLLALVCALLGVGSAVIRRRGGGFAFGALLFLALMLIDAGLSDAEVSIGVGFWIALGAAAAAWVVRLGACQMARDDAVGRPPDPAAGRTRRLQRGISAGLAVAAFGVAAGLDGLTAPDYLAGAGSADVDFSTEDWAPDWSSDGRWIVFASNRDDGGIFRVHADGSCLSRVTDGETAAWSPDGRRLVVARDEGRKATLIVLDADGGGEVVVASGELQNPHWSADGKHIYVERPTGEDTYAGFTLTLETRRLQRLAPPLVRRGDRRWSIASVSEDGVTVSPDGTRYAFMSSDDSSVPIDQLGEKLWVRRVGAPGRTRLTSPSRAGDFEPAWSPDGRTIAFQRSGEIAVVDADGGRPRVLTHVEGATWPAWSPDSRSIVFSRELNGTGGFFGGNASALEIVDVATGRVRKLTWGPEPVRSCADV